MPHATMESQNQALPLGDSNIIAEDDLDNMDPNIMSQMLEEINGRDLETGEKADDAIDFADISDEDLPEEEDDPAHDLQQLSGSTVQDFAGGEFEEDDNLDELFGGSSPIQERAHHEDHPMTSIETPGMDQGEHMDIALDIAQDEGTAKSQLDFRAVKYGDAEEDEDDDPEWQEQRRLFEAAKLGHRYEEPLPQASKEIFDSIWPNFEPGKHPRFHSLIPRKRAFFVPRTPLKPPKPLVMNKVSLDIAPDQEKLFRLPSTSATTKIGRQLEEEARGIVYITDGTEEEDRNEDGVELDLEEDFDDNEMIGNVSMADLKIAVMDWDLEPPSDVDEPTTPADAVDDHDDWVKSLTAPPTKKRRVGEDPSNPMQFSIYDHQEFENWDDPEAACARIAKKGPLLDMNDPYLLLEVQQPNAEPKKPRTIALQRGNRNRANSIFKRYNISNDEAYDALNLNNREKIRQNVGQMNVEHSLPALKLQYPFYKVSLSDRELRSFHRPSIIFKPGERAFVLDPKHVKRKHKKNLKPSEAFVTAEDLNIGDNSDLLLAEYSEEYPTTLSNFGMGNKIFNYYRRKDAEDTYRPKESFGEAQVLLPQDKSPFSLFGTVDPGETVPTLHNAMYRAPIFSHDPKPTDFLVSRSQTGVHGSKYYVRNIQNLVTVGQEFPLIEVPGTHARKVTEASKKRLKMLSFRLYRKGQQKGARQPWVSNEMIKYHLPGTEIAQNRSRMREIMKYDKEKGTWQPQDGDVIPDEAGLRAWIKPEDICLIDSMHAGDKHLQDAGFKANEIKDDEEAEDGDKLELQLAPWQTTKNFLNACASKAMLSLSGPGDPTGCGEAFSFIKVSMKGGFKDPGESAESKIDARKQKELGGHSYNVARQQRVYEEAIQRIWNAQKEGLSSKVEPDINEMEDGNVDTHQLNGTRGRTPRSEIGTPALLRDDDTMSQFSRNSNNDASGKVLKIKRVNINRHGEKEYVTQTITDPEVIRLYSRRKKQERLNQIKIDEIKPTGNAEFDFQQRLKLQAELDRLKRNVERREGREKAKGINQSVPGTPAANGKSSGSTPRKCANCGEIGHIKTNKKLCPLLNGQRKQSDTFRDAAAASPVTVAATPISATPQFAGSPQ